MLRETHDHRVKPSWEDAVAKAARHSGKFFDGRSKQLDQVVKNFRRLIAASHTAFYPEDRPGLEYDYLRDDLSVVTDGDEVLLTNVTGLFMVGMPPPRTWDRLGHLGTTRPVPRNEHWRGSSRSRRRERRADTSPRQPLQRTIDVVRWENCRGPARHLRRRAGNRCRAGATQHPLQRASSPPMGTDRMLHLVCGRSIEAPFRRPSSRRAVSQSTGHTVRDPPPPCCHSSTASP